MKKDIKKTIDLLNDLLLINQERAAAYRKVNDNLADSWPRMQHLADELIEQSNDFIYRIKQEIAALGGEASAVATFPGSTYSAWENEKPLLAGNHPQTMLTYCEQLEKSVGNVYDLALDETGIAETSVSLILLQKSSLRDSFANVKVLKEQQVAYAND